MSKGKKMQESLALVTVFLNESVQWLLCLLFLETESRNALIAMFAMYWVGSRLFGKSSIFVTVIKSWAWFTELEPMHMEF